MAVSLAATVVVAAVVFAPGAGATNGAMAHAAGFPSSIDVSVPAGGGAQVTSPSLPPTATELTVTATPAAGTSTDEFDAVAKELAPLGSFKSRFLRCLEFYTLYARIEISEDFSTSGQALAPLFLNACLEVAAQLSAPAKATGAAAGCPQTGRSIPIKITKTAGKYTLHVHGKPRVTRKLPLIVTCTRSGGGIQLDVRTRKPGLPLTRVVGPTLSIGYLSPSGSSSPAVVHTAFAIP